MKPGFILLIAFLAILISCSKKATPDLPVKETIENDTTLVYVISEKPSGIKEANRLGQWLPSSDFEATGLYLPPKQQIKIHVKNIEGNTQPKLLVGTYSRYKWQDRPAEYTLKEGINSITDYTGGLLYLRYVTNDVPSGKAELTFIGGKPVPVYKLGETTHANWLNMLDTMSYQDVLLISNRTMVVVSKETALKYKNMSQNNMLNTLDRIYDIEDYISGIDGSSPLHSKNVHRQLITETADESIFMAAAYNRIMANTRACNRFMDPVEAATQAWGLWHEMGHMHQMTSWCWNEVDEVTVNIYSLAAKKGLHAHKIWLEGDSNWDIVLNDYLQSPLENRNYNTSEILTCKGRLMMFDQLWLAFGDEFYIKVHRLAREDTNMSASVAARDSRYGQEKMAYFMLIASKASGYNLKDFFTQWGFKLPRYYFDALDSLHLPDPEIDLLSLRE